MLPSVIASYIWLFCIFFVDKYVTFMFAVLISTSRWLPPLTICWNFETCFLSARIGQSGEGQGWQPEGLEFNPRCLLLTTWCVILWFTSNPNSFSLVIKPSSDEFFCIWFLKKVPFAIIITEMIYSTLVREISCERGMRPWCSSRVLSKLSIALVRFVSVVALLWDVRKPSWHTGVLGLRLGWDTGPKLTFGFH